MVGEPARPGATGQPRPTKGGRGRSIARQVGIAIAAVVAVLALQFAFTYLGIWGKPSSAVDPTRTAALRAYLADNFGLAGNKTAWYDRVLRVAVADDIAAAATDLSPNTGDKQQANSICTALVGYASSTEHQTGIKRVRVYGQDGDMMIELGSIAELCNAP